MTDAASVPNATDAAQSDRLAAWLCAAGLLITAFFGWISPDGLYHFDDLTHFLYAKWSWRWPAYLLNDWGRPGFTALYAPAAYFGWPMCRAVSALLSAFAAWMAYRIAQRAGMTRAWAVDTASPAGAARRNPGSQGLSIANENGWHGRGRWRPCSSRARGQAHLA